MSKRRRWQEPSTVAARIQYRELRAELRRAKTKKLRDELIARLDALYARGTSAAPVKEPSPLNGSSLVSGSPTEKSIPWKGTAADVEAFLAQFVLEEARQVCADPVRRRNCAAHHVAITAGNLLNTENVLWEMLTWNRAYANPSKDAAAVAWVAELFAEVDRRDAVDPEWYFKVLAEPAAAKPTVNKPVDPPKLPAPQSAPSSLVQD